MSFTNDDLTLAKSDPSLVFNHPNEIARNTELSIVQKLELLRIWEMDAQQKMRAAGEGMPAGNPQLLQEVQNAIQSLEENAV